MFGLQQAYTPARRERQNMDSDRVNDHESNRKKEESDMRQSTFP